MEVSLEGTGTQHLGLPLLLSQTEQVGLKLQPFRMLDHRRWPNLGLQTYQFLYPISKTKNIPLQALQPLLSLPHPGSETAEPVPLEYYFIQFEPAACAFLNCLNSFPGVSTHQQSLPLAQPSLRSPGMSHTPSSSHQLLPVSTDSWIINYPFPPLPPPSPFRSSLNSYYSKCVSYIHNSF